MKNEKGFIHLLTLTLLPFVLGALLLLFSVAGVTQLNTRVQSRCRISQIRTQEKVRDLMEKLFAKNPDARRLRTEIIATEEALAAAPLLGLGTGYLTARLARLKSQQRILGIYQKTLLQAAAALLRTSALSTYQTAQQDLAEEGSSLRLLFQFDYTAFRPSFHGLPVRPEYPDVAPPYEPAPAFSRNEALVQKWKYKVRMKAPLDRFIRGSANFEKLCSTTLEQDDDSWTIVTQEDRSS